MMMTPIDFSKLRPHRGSVHNAFEELCCQLAACENVPPGSRFVCNGTPDAGVEGYWSDPEGRERAWQAKYFPSLGPSQWSQIDESVETALEKHPRIVCYTICLPIDLSDARISNQTSLRRKWDIHVIKWKSWAADRAMDVEFDLWGEHEILSRLTLAKHAGRRRYWFGGTEFSRDWFVRHLAGVKASPGPRYTPELNVQLPISRKFDALLYRHSFRSLLADERRKCLEAYRSFVRRDRTALDDPALEIATNSVEGMWVELERHLAGFGDLLPSPDSVLTLRLAIQSMVAATSELSRLKCAPRDTERSVGVEANARFGDWDLNRRRDVASERFAEALDSLRSFLDSASAELAGRPAMLIVGEVGCGKTHLLCDLADRSGEPTIVLLGQQLGCGEVWSQIVARLGLTCDTDEFLGAMEALAEAGSGRSLLMIDAINEAKGIRWLDNLPEMLAVLANYPRVGLVITCRSTCESHLIREDLVNKECLTRVVHRGFALRQFEALAKFCDHYGIETLNAPPLDPEFGNPLFLKLFCQGLQGKGLRRPPKGHRGLRMVFDFLIDSVEKKLSSDAELDYHPSEKVVRRALDAFVDALCEHRSHSLPLPEAQTVIGKILPTGGGYSKSLLEKLIVEGILADDLVWGSGPEPADVVRFAYERLADFGIASRSIDRNVRSRDDRTAFEEGGRFQQAFADGIPPGCEGILEALIVLVPERTGQEIGVLLPVLKDSHGFRSAFLAALPWRDPTHICPDAVAYVQELLSWESVESGWYFPHDSVFDRLVQVASQPGHPLNARWLHSYLARIPMPRRDALWSTYLHRSRAEQSGYGLEAIERLLNWAWQDHAEVVDPCRDFEDEVSVLVGLSLTWCFATPNRFVRDRATKALVSIFQWRVRLLPRLVDAFWAVDDLYVRERLLAATYGAVLRTHDPIPVTEVAKRMYDGVFAEGRPPAHVLLRDYARGVIEYALYLGCPLDVDVDLIRPPYASHPLPETLPDFSDIVGGLGDRDCYGLVFSITPTHGDFARYILGTDYHDRGLRTWTDLDDPYAVVRAMDSERVVESADNVAADADTARPQVANDLAHVSDDKLARLLSEIQSREAEFLASLTEEERQLLVAHETAETRIREAIEAARELERSHHLPHDYPSRWILSQVLELGWTADLFGEFDRNVHWNGSRAANNPERIGKKYQWIAYHELAARIFDHRPRHHSWFDGSRRYEGPWQDNFRDIDPSFLSRPGAAETSSPEAWWQPTTDLSGWEHLRDREWLSDRPSFPDLDVACVVERPSDGATWYALNSQVDWDESEVSRDRRQGDYRRRLSLCRAAFVARTEDLPGIVAAMSRLRGFDTAPSDIDRQFLGEFPWAPSFRQYAEDAASEFDGIVPNNTQFIHMPGTEIPMAHTATRYFHEPSGFDCSTGGPVSGLMPSVWLALRMGLTWDGKRMDFIDGSGRVVAFDPTRSDGQGPAVFLVEANALNAFLAESGLTLVWLAIGEKLIWSDTRPPSADELPVIEVFRQAFRLVDGRAERIARLACPLGGIPEAY